MQNKISKQYLDEAYRIRKEYLDNLKYIKEKKPLIEKYKGEVESYKKDFELISNSDNENMSKESFIEKFEQLLKKIDQVEGSIRPYYEKIEQLNNDSKRLNEMIKEKYPNITLDEIKAQIIPYVQELK